MINEKNFENIFRQHFTPLTNLAYSIVKDTDSAKDIVQQVFIKVWNSMDKLNIQSSLGAYLNRAVVNTALNHIEKQKKLHLHDDMHHFDKAEQTSNTENLYREEEIKDAVRGAIGKLPPKCQTVFSLSRYQGLSNREISEYLNISIKAVEKHITRALKDLRESLKPYLQQINAGLILAIIFLQFTGRVIISFICQILGGDFHG